MQISKVFEIFMVEKEASCSAKTLIYYRENLEKFFDYVSVTLDKQFVFIDCSELTRDLLIGYLAFLRQRYNYNLTDRRIKNTSVNTYYRAVKVFVNFCMEEEYIKTDILRKIKLPRSDEDAIIPLYNEEVLRIDNLFNAKTESGLRNLCIIHLMLDAGLRSGEVVKLRVCDVDFDKNIIKVFGKGGKYRVVLLCPKLKRLLIRYKLLYRSFVQDLESNCDYLSNPLFVQIGSSEFINANVIKQLFHRIKRSSGIDRVHPHLLRHTFATSYIMGGGNLEFLRMMLGHFDYSITRKYLHLGNQYMMMSADIYKLDSVFFKNAY